MHRRSASGRGHVDPQQRRQTNGQTLAVLTRLDSGGEETINSGLITPRQMARLRRTDPFSYFSIATARMGTSYCDLDFFLQDSHQGEPGDSDAGAGGTEPTNANLTPVRRSRHHSFNDTAPARNTVFTPRQARRSSMPNLELISVHDEHHIAARTLVKRRRRFATETDASTAIGRLMEGIQETL